MKLLMFKIDPVGHLRRCTCLVTKDLIGYQLHSSTPSTGSGLVVATKVGLELAELARALQLR